MLLPCLNLQGQDYFVRTKGEKLNILLNKLSEKENIPLSFNNEAMTAIELPKNKAFKNIEALFDYLKTAHYIQIDTIKNNYVLRLIPKKNYVYRGKIIDAETTEALPNAEIICGDLRTYSSERGFFTFLLPTIEVKKVQIRHLGYQITDTVISGKKIITTPLLPQIETIGNVIVSKSLKSDNINIGKRSGSLKLTPNFVRKLPGYGESSLFSFLKLMPGILATGESANDMSLRGSTEGQNLYIFDNYRVYSPWYRLNEIGTINPLLVKDIEVYKSGMDASVGENVGGVVLMKGLDAVPQTTKGEIFVNNFVANGMLEIPLSEKIAVIGAVRKNITESLKIPDAVGEYTIQNTFDGFADNYQMNINPKYQLYDTNLKFTYQRNEKQKLTVNGFVSEEKNKLNATTLTDEFRLQNRQQRHNKQYAGNIHFSHYSESGKHWDVIASYSSIKSTLNGLGKVLKLEGNNNEEYEIENNEYSFLEEFRLKIKRRVPFRSGGFLTYGVGHTASHIEEVQLPKDKDWKQDFWHQLSYGFANAQFMINPKWQTSIGSRINYSKSLKKVFFEPRLSLSYYPSSQWKLYSSYATLQQFVYSANVFDELKNSRFRRLEVGKNIPVFELNDWCLGVRFTPKNLILSAEAFYKYTDEKVRATHTTYLNEDEQYQHHNLQMDKVRYIGGDFFVKYQNKGLISWISYTISDFKTHNTKSDTETLNTTTYKLLQSNQFIFNSDIAYQHSDYDMRQELKTAIAYTWKKLTLSASYVYGSGFKMWHQPTSIGAPDYSRLDVGGFYKLHLFDTNAEFGCSILNVLNRKNKKLDEFSRFGVGDDFVSYNTYGLKLTPAFFVKIQF